MPLSLAEREEFLGQSHIAALAVSNGAERGPLMAPVWYVYEPGGRIWLVMRRDSRKGKLIAETGRFSLLVEEYTPITRYVGVEGRVVDSRPSTVEDRRIVAARYVAPEKVHGYVEFAREEYRFDLHVDHWLSADLGQP